MKQTTKEIIKLIETTNLPQMEIAKLGYSFATVRYHWRKIKRPAAHKRFLKIHSKLRKESYQEAKA
jgi:hypothetical protein